MGFVDCWAALGRPGPISTCRFSDHNDVAGDDGHAYDVGDNHDICIKFRAYILKAKKLAEFTFTFKKLVEKVCKCA